MSQTFPDPLRHYRAGDLIEARYTPYRDAKTVRSWMLLHGGYRLNARVVTITGAKLLEALNQHN